MVQYRPCGSKIVITLIMLLADKSDLIMEYRDYFESKASHRNFRRAIAAASKKPPEKHIRTLKFPVEAPEEGWTMSFDDCVQLFNTTDGLGKGSLAGLLFAIHLQGATIGAKAGDRFNNSLKKQFNDEVWNQELRKQLKLDDIALCPSLIHTLFSAENRKIARSNCKVTSGEALQFFLSQTEVKALQDASKLVELWKSVCNELQKVEAKVWKKLAGNDLIEVLECFDRGVKNAGLKLPKVAEIVASLPRNPHPDSTLFFEPNDHLCIDIVDDEIAHYQTVSVIAHRLRAAGNDVNVKAIQKFMFAGESASGLSWLLNGKYDGREIYGLGELKKLSAEELVELYGLKNSDLQRVQRIKEYADAIPDDPFDQNQGFHKYRTAISGKLESWIANYWSRLIVLDEILAEFAHADLVLGENWQTDSALQLGEPLGLASIAAMVAKLRDQKERLELSLGRLTGQHDELPSCEDIFVFQQFGEVLDELRGTVSQLNNAVDLKQKDPNQSDDLPWKSLKIVEPSWLKALPKIPSLSGGSHYSSTALSELSDRFNRLSERYDEILSLFVTDRSWEKLLACKAEQLEQNYGPNGHGDYKELAARWYWEQCLRVIQRLPENQRKIIANSFSDLGIVLATTPRKARGIVNGMVHNQKGHLYISPRSTSRHEPLACKSDLLLASNAVTWITSQIYNFKSMPKADFKTITELTLLLRRLTTNALPAVIQCDKALIELFDDLPLTASQYVLLGSNKTTKNTLARALNVFQSEIRGLMAQLLRSRFFLRTRFVRVGQNQLYYRPKVSSNGAWAWQPPRPWFSSPMGRIMSKMDFNKEDSREIKTVGLSNLLERFQKSSEMILSQPATDGLGPVLREMPHDWCIDLGLGKGIEPFSNASVLKVAKGEFSKKAMVRPHLARLIGSSAFKGELDKALVNPNQTFGEYTLIIEQHYAQTAEWSDEGKLVVSAHPSELKVSVALPLYTPPAMSPGTLQKAFVAIDLGEAGIGYAAYCAEKFELLESGAIPIPSIRKLKSQVGRHRKRKQPSQKFVQQFDTSLMKFRENVVGDVTHCVDSLMRKFNGAPIFESSVRNLSKGSNQLKLVYDKILNLYTFSSTDAHKAARKHFWCGAEHWEHPEITEVAGKEKKTRQLLLYPGTDVHPAGTSQRCSECGFNPYHELQAAFELSGEKSKTKKLFTSDNHGVVALGDYQLQVRCFVSGEKKKARKQGLNARPSGTLRNKPYSFEELRRQLKKQLRQPQRSIRSRDTTQSVFLCPNTQCGAELHADENAAKNIFNKWLVDRGIQRIQADNDGMEFSFIATKGSRPVSSVDRPFGNEKDISRIVATAAESLV